METQPVTQEKTNGVQKEEKKEVVKDVKPIEAKPEEPLKKEEIQTSTRLASLAKREKEIVKREKEAKKLLEQASGIQKDWDVYKKSPKKILELLGTDFEGFSKLFLDEMEPGKGKTAEDLVKEVAQKVDQKFSELDEKEQKKQQEEYDRGIELFKKDLKKTIETSEQFELIKENDAFDTVFEVIQNYYQETYDEETGEGKYLSVEDAAAQVESYLEEQVEKLLKTKKLQAKFQPKPEEVKEEKKEEKKESKTLSNKATASSSFNPGEKLLSREESIRKAAQKLKWK